MQTSQLLKKEINQTVESLHDFAKWKLIVTAAIAAAALGLMGQGNQPVYWLLLFIPYACAYVDLNCYQYQIRITVISRFLRQLCEDKALGDYERLCEELRIRDNVFDLGKYAQVGASLFISIIAGLIPIWQFAKARVGLTLWQFLWSRQSLSFWTSAVVWLSGLLLIGGLWKHFDTKNKAADYQPPQQSRQDKPAAEVAKAAG